MSPLSNEDRLALVEVARRAISTAVIDRSIAEFPPFFSPLSGRGAFVTLRRLGKLRGCVGQVENPGLLMDVVIRSAVNAALHDGRFPPVSAEEIPQLDIEISVLSPLEPIQCDAIIPGRHGLMVIRQANRGLLLPQVASERGWATQRFLEETCLKAGLPADAWQDPETHVFGFTAEVFSESEIRKIANSGSDITYLITPN